MKKNLRTLLLSSLVFLTAACGMVTPDRPGSAGIEQRQELESRVAAVEKSLGQLAASFDLMLVRFRELMALDRGDSDQSPDLLHRRLAASERLAAKAQIRITALDRAAAELFECRQRELDLYITTELREKSQIQLQALRQDYYSVLSVIRKAQAKSAVTFDLINDQLLFLTGNFNPPAIRSLQQHAEKIEMTMLETLNEFAHADKGLHRLSQSIKRAAPGTHDATMVESVDKL